MRTILMAAAASLVTVGAWAQPAASPPRTYDPAPWWTDKPILASTGSVWMEVKANRATTAATYEVVDRDVAAATRAAADKVRALGQALAAFGAERVEVSTSYNITPLYEQYRDKQGAMNDNERADKIERYQASIAVRVKIRDVALVEQVYATLMSAKPTSSETVSFSLEPENETLTQMARLATEDARRRAVLSADAAGARLGAVRLIDPTGRACETDVLVAGADRSYGEGGVYPNRLQPRPPSAAASMQDVVVTAQRRANEAGLKPEDFKLPVQPPMQRLEGQACVIFSLG